MAIKKEIMREVLTRISRDQTLAEALIHEGIESFIRLEPASLNPVLQGLLGKSITEMEHEDLRKIMAKARTQVNSSLIIPYGNK